MKNISIIGAGLAGTMAALYLARRGYHVSLYEARADLRNSNVQSGRSINLALSCRGITSLKKMNLYDEVSQILVPMRARAIHEENGNLSFQSFGRHENEYINAVMRSELNTLLLSHAERKGNIDIYFECNLQDIDFENKKLIFNDASFQEVIHDYQIILGADGASSMVRTIMSEKGLLSFTRTFLPYGYKELSISEQHETHLVREHLHLWPRESFMLLGNPNKDDSITGSLFIAHEGKNSLEHLKNEGSVIEFFTQYFPDVIQCMPNLMDEFFNHPTGNMSTINCSNWHYQDHCMLLGDAAHGIVPFFGQGMNCAFEDCRILDELVEKYDDDWSSVMPAFFKARKKNTEAVAEMSMDNYREIQYHIRDPKFNLKKQVEKALMQRYPDEFVTKHVLVMFSNTSYQIAFEIGRLQDEFINQICRNLKDINDMDWQRLEKDKRSFDKKMAQFQLSF